MARTTGWIENGEELGVERTVILLHTDIDQCIELGLNFRSLFGRLDVVRHFFFEPGAGIGH